MPSSQASLLSSGGGTAWCGPPTAHHHTLHRHQRRYPTSSSGPSAGAALKRRLETTQPRPAGGPTPPGAPPGWGGAGHSASPRQPAAQAIACRRIGRCTDALKKRRSSSSTVAAASPGCTPRRTETTPHAQGSSGAAVLVYNDPRHSGVPWRGLSAGAKPPTLLGQNMGHIGQAAGCSPVLRSGLCHGRALAGGVRSTAASKTRAEGDLLHGAAAPGQACPARGT